jgi:hypothetical protein
MGRFRQIMRQDHGKLAREQNLEYELQTKIVSLAKVSH